MPKSKGKIAAASMAAGAGGSIGAGLSGKAIEAAMNQATLDALAKGITDSDEILKLKLAAREKVKADHRASLKRTEKEAAKAAKPVKAR
jgi:hypothetical protein